MSLNATELLLLMTALQMLLFAVGWWVALISLERDRATLRGFLWFNLLNAVALVIIAFRADPPHAFERAVPNLLILAGMVALTSALHGFWKIPQPRWLYAPVLVAALCVVWFGVIARDDANRVFALLAGFFWLLVICMWRTYRTTREEFGWVAANVLSFVALITLVTLSWRTYAALFTAHTVDLNQPSRFSDAGNFVMMLAANGPNLLYASFVALRLVRSANEVAMRDSLTELLNHRAFMIAATQSFARRRSARQSGAVVAIDLDHFKRINDAHGHQTGDEVLRGFATILRSCCDKRCIVGRTGGEEFIVVIERADELIANQFAERLRRRVARATWESSAGRSFKLTMSIGIAADIANDQRANDALLRADRALYAAKSAGRDRIAHA